jgi:MFS superfamily sulfate permease-like transporter
VTQPIEAETRPADSRIPGYEPWLGVAAASFVPVLLMFVVPRTFVWPLAMIAGLLFLVALAMLIRQERRVRPDRPGA